jgi:hypothetical protein
MGLHYVPRKYLEGFTEVSTDFVWVYDKDTGKKYRKNITNVAQEKEYYSLGVEEYLKKEVEDSGHVVLDQIRGKMLISTADKRILSEYIVALMKRGPSGKLMLNERAPMITQDLISHFESEIMNRRTLNPSKSDFYDKRLSDLKEILNKFAIDPSEKVWEASIPPETTPKVIEIICNMTWSFGAFSGPPVFLTSDNPVFFFKSIGLGKPISELSFPISSNIALWASWRQDLKEGYFKADQQVIRQLNRITVSNAVRYVFHEADESWILRFINKKHQLSLLKLKKKR